MGRRILSVSSDHHFSLLCPVQTFFKHLEVRRPTISNVDAVKTAIQNQDLRLVRVIHTSTWKLCVPAGVIGYLYVVLCGPRNSLGD